MRARFWLNSRADALDLDSKEASRLAVLAPDTDSRRRAKARADAYRIAATELRSCANEFPEHLEPAGKTDLLGALRQV